MLWPTVKSLFGKTRAAQAYGLQDTYRKTFVGSDEGKAVLADLVDYTGFYLSSSPDTSPEARAYQDGMRNVVSRIHAMIRVTDDERNAIETAFFKEASDK